MTQHRTRHYGQSPQLLAGATANFLLLLALSVLAILREQQGFWLDAGGWPVRFRDFVAGWFYPLLALEMVLLLGFSAACLHARRTSSGAGAGTLPALWLFLLLIVVIISANNLDNLLSGRPIHWHPE